MRYRLVLIAWLFFWGSVGLGPLRANVLDPFAHSPAATDLLELIHQELLGRHPTALPTAAEVARDPARYIRDLRADLHRGRLGRFGPVGEMLLQAAPDDPEVHGLYGLYLAVSGQTVRSRAQLQKARPGAAGIPLVELAESINLRLEGDAQGALRLGKRAAEIDPRHPYVWNVLGRAYLDAGLYAEASESFNRAVQLNTAFSPGYVNLGAVAFLREDFHESVRAYERAVALDPSDAGARYGLAVAAEALGDSGTATAQLQEALRLQPNDTRFLLRLTRIHLRQGQPDQALVHARRLLTLRVPGAHLFLADAFLQQGDYPAARQHLDQADAENPERSYLLGYWFLATANLAEALVAMDRTLKLNPDHTGAWLTGCALRLQLGQASDLAGDFPSRWPANVQPLFRFLQGCYHASRQDGPAALEAFRAAEGFLPGFSMAGLDSVTLADSLPPALAGDLALGVLLHLKQLPAPSMAALHRVLEVQPNSCLGHYWAGVVQLGRGNRNEARAHFKSSVLKAPNFFAGLFAAGELAFTVGEVEEAASYYRRAQAVRAEAGLSLRLGLFYENTGDLATAEEQYRQVIELAPDFFVGYNQLAWFLASRGWKLDEALRLAQRADALLPGNASVLDTLGWIYHLTGQPGPAREHIERAAEVNPQNPTIWYHLGVVRHSQGETAMAKEALERALKLSSTFGNAADARKLLDQLK